MTKGIGGKALQVPELDVGADRKALQEKSREIAQVMWSGKLTVNEKAALNHICKMYGLDPLLKEVIFLGGNFYIVVSGMVRIANQNKEMPLAGIDLRPATEEERKLIGVAEEVYLWRCEVWKKGSDRPFVEWGEASADDVNLHGKKVKDIRAMARTRAKGRALKEAYSVSLPIYEEGDLSHKYPDAVEIEETPKEEKDSPDAWATESQKKAIDALCAKKSLGEEQVKAILGEKFGEGVTMATLSNKQASEVITYLNGSR